MTTDDPSARPAAEQPPVRVLIADDHAVLREGLAMLLDTSADIAVVGLAADGAAAVESAAECEPDVILMDVSMPVLDGIAATRAVLSARPGVAVVMLTTFADRQKVLDSLDAGAVGYLMKDSPAGDVVAGVLAAARGGSPLDPRVARQLVDLQRREAVTTPVEVSLTAKQREVLALVAQGLSNRLIARRLDIAEKTVKAHLTTIYSQLGVSDRVQAAIWAQRHGLTDP